MIIIHVAQKYIVLYKAEINKKRHGKRLVNYNIDCHYDCHCYQSVTSLSEY